MRLITRPFLFLLGLLSLILGIIGAFLPILPTTPFAILSAYCFSKSSPRMHQYILSLPLLGPLVVDWEKYRVIRPKAKIWCTFVLSTVMGLSMYLGKMPIYIKYFMFFMGVAVLTFIWSRKSSISKLSS
jgi:uncharacterized membrane protein YbaN (DUF454 family)